MPEKTAGNHRDRTSPKLMTAKQVQEEYLNIDIRRLRVFLNTYCHYRKIGRQYYYVRDEVEKRLLETDGNMEYQLAQGIHKPKISGGRRKK